MAPDLGNIDVSLLDTLARLEADQRSIRALSEKAAWHRDKVFEVYSRVVSDYTARVGALEERLGTVRQRVREDLRTLDALYIRCRNAVDQARVDLQESEFRREIGEFTREEFLKRQEAAERTIADREQEFEGVKALRLRYLELLPGEPVVPPPHVPAPPAPAAPVGAAPPAPPDEAVTDFVSPPSVAATQAASPAWPSGPGEALATVAVSSALLIEDQGGQPGAHHRLGVLTTVGRTPDNHIVVPVREVSRRHAEIVLTEVGYVLKDLGSPNGTFVNGERIAEHRLQDEDRIAMGGQVFVFRTR
jgi:hypothetical protein